MTDLLPVLTPAPTTPPVSASGGAGAREAGSVAPPFALTLDAFLDGQAPNAAAMVSDERQVVADDGKDLPVSAAQDANDDIDPASSLAPWLSLLVPPPAVPQAMVAPPSEPLQGVELNVVEAGSNVQGQSPFPGEGQGPVAERSLLGPGLRRGSEEVVSPVPAHTTPTETALPDVAVPNDPLPVATDLPRAAETAQRPAPLDTQQSIAPRELIDRALNKTEIPTQQPVSVARTITLDLTPPGSPPRLAGQVFAAALAEATSWQAKPARGGPRGEELALTTTILGSASVDRPVVQPVADTSATTIDLARDQGLQHMIDRIETLRDDADARDTRVRLVPDALGTVDVAVRRDGDALHVRFTAEHAATRALIADAQPRLTELAAARGVRIAETSIDAGASGGGTQPQPRPAAIRPARAHASTQAANIPSTDHRLA